MTPHIREARPGDAAALATCVVEPIVDTFQGRVPDRCLEWLTPEESAANWLRWFSRQAKGQNRGQFLLVVEPAAATVAGCALGGPQVEEAAFGGELFLIGILPAYQGQGLGKCLLGAVAARLAAAGIHSLGVRVLRANPNCSFYEHLGARYLREEPYDWNGVVLPEAVYVWEDTAPLLAAPEA